MTNENKNDQDIEKVYEQINKAQMPQDRDADILAAAHRAVGAKPARLKEKRKPRFFSYPELSIAATVVVSVMVVLLVNTTGQITLDEFNGQLASHIELKKEKQDYAANKPQQVAEPAFEEIILMHDIAADTTMPASPAPLASRATPQKRQREPVITTKEQAYLLNDTEIDSIRAEDISELESDEHLMQSGLAANSAKAMEQASFSTQADTANLSKTYSGLKATRNKTKEVIDTSYFIGAWKNNASSIFPNSVRDECEFFADTKFMCSAYSDTEKLSQKIQGEWFLDTNQLKLRIIEGYTLTFSVSEITETDLTLVDQTGTRYIYTK